MQTISQKTVTKKPEIKVEATAKGMTVNAVYSFSDAVLMTVCGHIA